MSESSLWSTARLHLGPFLDLVRVENRLGRGTPDVEWGGFGLAGWIELKYLPRWPARAETPIHLPKLTLAQVAWAEEHGAKHRVAMLLQVGGPRGGYGLFGPAATRGVYERKLPRLDLIRAAGAWAEGSFPSAAIVRALTGRGEGAREGALPVAL